MKTPNLTIFSFEETFSFSSLLDAHKRCRCSKSHKREVIEFELNLDRNLAKLSNNLLTGNYKITHYRNFVIHEPKIRNIESLCYKHRMVQMVLCRKILEPMLERHLIETNCACRCARGTGFAREKFELFLHRVARKYQNKAYFLKCDVRKYFASIDHEILLEKLEKLNFEPRAFELLKIIVRSHNTQSGVGIPIGNQTSQWFALFYLDEIDRLIKEKFRCKYYVRYMDDLVIIDNDREKLERLKKCVIEKGKELKLLFNEKTQICSLSQGVGFIGHFYKVDKNGKVCKKMKQSSKNRLKTALKRISFLTDHKLVDSSFVQERLVCYKNYYSSYYQKQYLDKQLNKYLGNVVGK